MGEGVALYRIVIVDDDSRFVDYMKEIILKCNINMEDITFEEFYSGEEFVAQLNMLSNCDLLILDMQMKKMDGHATARKFRERFPHSVLVFCSGVSHPTDESFKVTPFRYLLKDYTEQVMIMEMNAIIRQMQSIVKAPVIMGRNHDSFISLASDDIMYIENSKAGSIIHLCRDRISDFKYQVNTKRKLADLYKELKDCHFEYAHNSYLVNLKYVTKLFSQGYIQLKDGTELNVSRSKMQNFRNVLTALLSKKYDY